MLVMRDGCDSTADENEADVLKLKHSSCVRPLRHANFHPVHLERPNKENCFERLMKLHHVTCEGNCSPEKGEHTLSNQTPALLIWLMVTLRVLTGLQGAVHAIHFLINLWKYIRKAMWHRFTSPCMQNPELKFRSTNGCFRFFCFVLHSHCKLTYFIILLPAVLSMALLSNLYCQVWCFTVPPVEALRIPFIPKTISGIPQIPITSPFTGDYNSLGKRGAIILHGLMIPNRINGHLSSGSSKFFWFTCAAVHNFTNLSSKN